MAKFTIKAGEEYELKLSRLATDAEEIAKRAIYEGARIVADKVRSNIASLPTDKFRFLRGTDKLNGLTSFEKADLLTGLGITPMATDGGGNWDAKIGFDGYGSMPTKRYPKGVPIQLIARSVESGSSIRRKKPFVRPALTQTKAQAEAAMARVIEEEITKIMG